MSHHVGRRSTRGVMLLWNGTYASLVPTQLASAPGGMTPHTLLQQENDLKWLTARKPTVQHRRTHTDITNSWVKNKVHG